MNKIVSEIQIQNNSITNYDLIFDDYFSFNNTLTSNMWNIKLDFSKEFQEMKRIIENHGDLIFEKEKMIQKINLIYSRD
ncbi:hypothetical protein [Mycoplasma zalophi]|uniref:Uncharacterized protein n=1 Tax=Mycoplasma zalophi TaxID=191287 RepID=A0ABS6DQQ1_9MOLU|nr:hypothetical protein [Mycoplasma zalophi]MBU4690958.1 hypothetical protein [Mycoplasma zalophi]MBU4692262.1 hypothetical protein [Mycoplasma zalophi]